MADIPGADLFAVHVDETDEAYILRIRLPSTVDAERAVARCEGGLLSMELPKAGRAKPRRVPVQAASEEERQRDDVVDEGSEMSFPASDPPAWTPGKPGGATD